MGLLDRPGQSQRYGLLSPDVMSLIQSGGPRVVPSPAPPAAPTAPRAGPGWLTYLLGGSEGMASERAAREAERLRPQREAETARIAALVRAMPADAQIAYALNPEKFGEALSSRSEGRVLDQGDVYMSGETPGYAAPFDAAPGSAIFDPRNPGTPVAMAPQENKVAGGALVAPDGRVLYRGPAVEGVAATADAFFTPEIAQGNGGGAPRIVRESRPETVTVAPGGEVLQFNPDGSLVGRVASTQARPMSDADQAAVARAENTLAQNRVARGRAAQFRQQLASGDLNLGPMTNGISGLRNLTGRSDANSLNYDALMNWAKEARDAILSANTGVQTDGDAVRALERIISTPNDERVVAAALQRFEESQAATAQVFERDIQRRSAGPAPAAPASPAAGQRLSPEQASQLPPGTRFVGMDGVERVRQ